MYAKIKDHWHLYIPIVSHSRYLLVPLSWKNIKEWLLVSESYKALTKKQFHFITFCSYIYFVKHHPIKQIYKINQSLVLSKPHLLYLKCYSITMYKFHGISRCKVWVKFPKKMLCLNTLRHQLPMHKHIKSLINPCDLFTWNKIFQTDQISMIQ